MLEVFERPKFFTFIEFYKFESTEHVFGKPDLIREGTSTKRNQNRLVNWQTNSVTQLLASELHRYNKSTKTMLQELHDINVFYD